MNRRRGEILRAIALASEAATLVPPTQRTNFDIVGLLQRLEITFVFRPLANLWGAAVTVGQGTQGILVTNQLDLAVQRFTLAHELGHLLLGHGSQFDSAESIGFAGRFAAGSHPVQEVAADTFASELLASKRLIRNAALRHQWDRAALRHPSNAYQLSLRLGISYQAACWSLAAHELLPASEARSLAALPAKDIKRELVPADLTRDPWASVWRIGMGDSGSHLEAGPHDLFVLELWEESSAGYLWELLDAPEEVVVLAERTDLPSDYGAHSARVLILGVQMPGVHRLHFAHRRPWSSETIEHIDLSVDSYGKERGGFARRYRESILASA